MKKISNRTSVLLILKILLGLIVTLRGSK